MDTFAAYSRADAVRLCQERFGLRGWQVEIRDYWSEGGWGNAMIGVTPHRGLFAQKKDGSLVEILGIGKEVPLERDDPQAWVDFQEKEQTRRDNWEAERQRLYRERCERLSRFLDAVGIRCGHDPESDVAIVEHEGFKFTVKEVE